MRRFILVLLLVVACSNDEERKEKQAECDKRAADIRTAAQLRGLEVQGVCNNSSAPEFAQACASLERCNRELDEL